MVSDLFFIFSWYFCCKRFIFSDFYFSDFESDLSKIKSIIKKVKMESTKLVLEKTFYDIGLIVPVQRD